MFKVLLLFDIILSLNGTNWILILNLQISVATVCSARFNVTWRSIYEIQINLTMNTPYLFSQCLFGISGEHSPFSTGWYMNTYTSCRVILLFKGLIGHKLVSGIISILKQNYLFIFILECRYVSVSNRLTTQFKVLYLYVEEDSSP
jgi:hypothetical protein